LSLNGDMDTGANFYSAPTQPLIINRKTGYGISFRQNNVEEMVLNASGNLGLGGLLATTPALNRGMYVQSDTNNAIIGYSLYVNDSVNNRRGSMFLDDAAGLWGWDNTASSGLMDYVWRSATTERMRLSSTGNLGLGVTPSPWVTYRAIQLGATASAVIDSSGGFGTNYYFDGTNYRYVSTSSVALYSAATGQHRWFTAPSGTASNVITLTQAMTLDASGNLGVGTTGPLGRLHVSGADSFRLALIGGATRAVRIGADAVSAFIGGVDPTGVGSFQPLHLEASILLVTAGGAERVRVKADGQVRFVPLAAAPTTSVENGDVYYDSTTNKLRVRAAGAWVDLH
jgi:hypothetical protein